MDTPCQSCNSTRHTNSAKFSYPKDKVPVQFFRKNPEDPNSKLFKTCSQCREFDKLYGTKYRAKHVSAALIAKEQVVQGISNVLYCPAKIHGGGAPSQYPRNAVPIDLFRKTRGNVYSELWEWCEDCRDYMKVRDVNYRDEARIVQETTGIRMCVTCLKPITEIMFTRKGKLTSNCGPCRQGAVDRSYQLRSVYLTIKLEMIQRTGVSCVKCQMLYFKPLSPDSLVVTFVQTYVKSDGHRYGMVGGIEYLASAIVTTGSSLLELTIIELDHLTMEEQLVFGLIRSPEEFVPKKDRVSALASEADMRLEARKCQHICGRCHVAETLNRETGVQWSLRKSERKKTEYVHSLKRQGCSSCGYINPRLMRFFEMDHLRDKVSGISEMCKDPAFSYEDVVAECAKARVLCRFCHRIHTNKSYAHISALTK